MPVPAPSRLERFYDFVLRWSGGSAYVLAGVAMYLAWLFAWMSWNGSDPSLLILICSPILFGILAFGLYSVWISKGVPRGYLTTIHLLCVALYVSVASWNWPLKWNFANSRSALDQLMARVVGGETPYFPRQVGGFQIQRVERRGSIMLVTVPIRSGNEGLVWTANPQDGPGFNPWSEIRLAKNWWLVKED